MTAGFSGATWDFLDRLAAANTRATFEAARGTYERAVVAPSVALVESLGDLLHARVHPGLQADPAVGRSRFRLNRDLRFSRDKTPYKTHLDFLFWVGDGPPRAQPACILRLTSTEVLLGAGQMGLSREALTRYRERLDDPEGGGHCSCGRGRARSRRGDAVGRGPGTGTEALPRRPPECGPAPPGRVPRHHQRAPPPDARHR